MTDLTKNFAIVGRSDEFGDYLMSLMDSDNVGDMIIFNVHLFNPNEPYKKFAEYPIGIQSDLTERDGESREDIVNELKELFTSTLANKIDPLLSNAYLHYLTDIHKGEANDQTTQ